MKERPILLNGDMVRAVLNGSKTQTRRIMKVQPSADFSPMNMELETDFTARWYTPGVVDKDGYLQPAKKQVFGVASEDEGYTSPFGAVGDRLWVRETWSEDFANYYPNDRVWYAAMMIGDWTSKSWMVCAVFIALKAMYTCLSAGTHPSTCRAGLPA
nr:hypothetical protein [Pantoea wallisii]